MISHDYKLIFVHVPKCAGRSVCDIFNQRFDHYTARYYEQEYHKFWQQYTRFTIVRHPLDRLVSLYYYVKEHRRHKHEDIGRNIQNFNIWLQHNIAAYHGEFWNNAEGNRGTDGDLGSPFWFTSQYRRIVAHSGNIELDRVFHLEDGNGPVNEFLSGIIGKETILPHVNESVYKDWRSHFNNETYALASEFFPVIEDCRKLGYEL